MRVHSMSPSIGLGVPMIPLVTQERMTDFLAGIGLADLRVEAFGADVADALTAAIDRTLTDPNTIRARFGKARQQMRDLARGFDARVEALLGA